MLLLSPLEQFQIISLYSIKLGKLDFSITNALLISLISLLCFSSIIYFASSNKNSSNNLFTISIIILVIFISFQETSHFELLGMVFNQKVLQRSFHTTPSRYSGEEEIVSSLFTSEDVDSSTPGEGDHEVDSNIPFEAGAQVPSEEEIIAEHMTQADESVEDKSYSDMINETANSVEETDRISSSINEEEFNSSKFETSEELLNKQSLTPPPGEESSKPPSNPNILAKADMKIVYDMTARGAAVGSAALTGGAAAVAMAGGMTPGDVLTGAEMVQGFVEAVQNNPILIPGAASVALKTTSMQTDMPIKEPAQPTIPATDTEWKFDGCKVTKTISNEAVTSQSESGSIISSATAQVLVEGVNVGLRTAATVGVASSIAAGTAVLAGVALEQHLQQNESTNKSDSSNSSSSAPSSRSEQSTPNRSSISNSDSTSASNNSGDTESTSTPRRAMEDLI